MNNKNTIGTSEYVNNWMDNKVQSWVDEITTLSTIVRTQPQSAFSALTHGIMSHWTYILRTCPDISTHLIPLENTLRTVFIPALTSQGPPNDLMRDLFSLPFRLEGLGIPNPSLLSNDQYANSLSVTAPFINLLVNQCDSIPSDVFSAQLNAKQIIRNSRSRALRERSITIRSDLPPPLQRLFDIANEKGSSTWLSVLPLKSHGYHLHKGAFRDSLCLRFGWNPPLLPNTCVCGTPFTVDHALNCPCGGLPSLRHNELRDIKSFFYEGSQL